MPEEYARKVAEIEAMPEAEIQTIAEKIAENGEADYPGDRFREVFGQTANDLAGAGWHGRFGPIMRQQGFEILLEVFPDGRQGCKVRKVSG